MEKKTKQRKFIAIIIDLIREVFTHTEGAVTEFFVRWLLKRAPSGGFKVWLIKFLVGEINDRYGKPIVESLIRNTHSVYVDHDAKKKYKEFKKAFEKADTEEKRLKAIKDLL